MSEIVRMTGIVKRFPGVLANDHIDFAVNEGEVHALLGENGAGKTTLMNILYGLYRPDEGEIFVRGQPVSLHSPADAIRLRIGMVHQTFKLIPPLSVVENVILGMKSSQEPFLDIAQAERRLRALSDQYGLEVDPEAKIWQLPLGVQQRVEILKALYRGADLLILDEPTSVLTPQETEGLFALMRRMAERRHAVIFITHKLDEVMAVADRITVLRDGRVVSCVVREDTDKKSLARMMVGREVLFHLEIKPKAAGQTVLELKQVHALSDKGLPALQGLSLSVCAGEIVGVAGIDGNGQKELAEVISGLRPVMQGRVFLNGQDITNHPPKQIIDQAVAYVPEDRRGSAVFLNFPLDFNAILKIHDKPPIAVNSVLNEPAIARHADQLVTNYDIRVPGRSTLVKFLSGGNLQRLILARELSRDPQLIVASHPTAGLDVSAMEFIHNHLLAEREKGKAILLITADLDEVLALSDIIAVMYQGQIVGVFSRDQADVEAIGLLMAGSREVCTPGLDEVRAHYRSVQQRMLHQAGPAVPTPKIVQVESATAEQVAVIPPEPWRMALSWLRRYLGNELWVSVGISIVAILAALSLVALLMLVLGIDPLRAYGALFRGSLGTKNGIGETLVRTSPLLLAALAVLVAFRSGLWNIGAEGQLYLGGLGAVLVGLWLPNLSPAINLPLTVLGGFLFGALWAIIPGFLRAWRGTNEIVTTIMMNYIAVVGVNYLVAGPLRDPGLAVALPQTRTIASFSLLPNILPGTRAHAGILLGILAIGAVYFIFWKTAWGYEMRAVGANPLTARYGGIEVARRMVLAMGLSGGLAGLAGMVEVSGVWGYLPHGFSSGTGFTAIAVALLGGLHPVSALLSSFLFGALSVGADSMQRMAGVSTATANIVQGLVVLFVLGRQVLRSR